MISTKKRFSKRYRTFGAWRRNRELTAYARRIIKLHRLNPTATLADLGKETIKNLALSKRSWASLSSALKAERILYLKIRKLMKSGKSFTRALDEIGGTKEMALRHLHGYISQIGRKYFLNKKDFIEREMVIYENGEITSIIVGDSETASLIGKYFAAVRRFLNSKGKDTAGLEKFKNIIIKDIFGVRHKLETDPKTILLIEEQKEDEEFFEIYRLK
jgi:hypothetical protein